MSTTSSSTASAHGVARSGLEATWDASTPLTPVGFYPRSGLLPAVVEVRDQTGGWDAPGQTRQLMLSDGGSVVEHTVLVDRPGKFVYELSDFQKLFGVLVSGARAEWEYSEVPGGTRIDWTYTFFARPRAGLVLRGIVSLLWGPYMRRVLPGIIAEVERQDPAHRR
ncbi:MULTISPECIES: SRPBCC family protein [unclassified Frondihabitans]|uniref:SRPBCC family protein n=1 Tax=unclassified Frondihabitans TaxID=2626248 RepID=UPI000F514A58|nr:MULTISPECIES: SRPBCC family protein [unclassified Frondihabitans]RPE77579.1 polyketide cyclase/dehydrase/lipid transport protein [Frondihabitans sp. PhB153]RPF07856.1 polyketide cyclase/dehydrase/lipid transport protein [Frondihabitans sp. PhB161]